MRYTINTHRTVRLSIKRAFELELSFLFSFNQPPIHRLYMRYLHKFLFYFHLNLHDRWIFRMYKFSVNSSKFIIFRSSNCCLSVSSLLSYFRGLAIDCGDSPTWLLLVTVDSADVSARNLDVSIDFPLVHVFRCLFAFIQLFYSRYNAAIINLSPILCFPLT